MKRTLTIALAAFSLVTVPHVQAAAADPCALVDRADAAKALQGAVTTVRLRDMGAHVTCTYRTNELVHDLVVTMMHFDSSEEAKSEFGTMISSPMTQTAPSQRLSGIGDGAQRLGPMIYVVKGNGIYVFSLIEKDGNGAGALRTIALAKNTISRLHN